MEKPVSIQHIFFEMIKRRLPSHVSLANELSELLNVSIDSAYRRLRGQKELTFDEIQVLCLHYGISVDTLLHNSSDIVPFQYQPYHHENFNFIHYLQAVAGILESTWRAEEKLVYFEGKDVPLANLVYFPEMISFKSFFWSKVIYNHPEYHKRKFDIEDQDPKVINLGNKILNLLQVIPTIEIWNEDTVNTTIRQIEYCYEAGYFETAEVKECLLQKFSEWLEHFRLQAETGARFKPGHDYKGLEGNFQLYYTDALIPNNNILIKKNNAYTAYLSQNDLTILVTRNHRFALDQKEWMENLIRKSTSITVSSEKERNQFFRKLNNKIEQLQSKLV